VNIGNDSVRTFVVGGLATSDIVQLRAVQSVSDGNPVLLYANSSAALHFVSCGAATCGSVEDIVLASGAATNATLSLISESDGAIVAAWISNFSLTWIRCPPNEPCAPEVVFPAAAAVVGVLDAVAVESPNMSLIAFAIVESNRETGEALLHLRQCADTNCSHFAGDYLGEPVPTGFQYVDTVIVCTIIGLLVIYAIPVCITVRKHRIR